MKLLIPQITILMILWMIMHSMKMKKKLSVKTLTPFECGYNSFFSKLPMSVQFTLLVFVFLLFDIELSILISSNWNMTPMNKEWISSMYMFLMFMTISIIYEMSKKSFKWT